MLSDYRLTIGGMFEINAENAAEYLRSSGRDGPRAEVSYDVRELAGGVSNVVLLTTPTGGGEPLVLKQARGRLRVKEEWLCPVERIWREIDVLRICGDVLGSWSSECRIQNAMSAEVPRILWEDRENFLYAMTAAPAGHCSWKELLLAGELGEGKTIAAACGELLARLHAGTWQDAAVAEQLADRTYFDQLRLDPYYRQVARVHPDLALQIERLIDSVWQYPRCLVHGDFSPKNLLVSPGRVTPIDFEVGHYGDPAFDLGFFLTHLVLKAIWSGPRRADYVKLADVFWTSYCEVFRREIATAELNSLDSRMVVNLAGCLLARVDGKSPVDYLTATGQALVRNLARDWLRQPPPTWEAAVSMLPLVV
jgi:5-methylthioribose kinase